MPALVTAFLAYFVFTRRWFWIAVIALILIGRLTGHDQ
jgi:hypothetical protein